MATNGYETSTLAIGGVLLLGATGVLSPDDGTNGDDGNGNGNGPGNGNGGTTNKPPEGLTIDGTVDAGTVHVSATGSDPDGTINQWQWRLERTDTGSSPSVVDTDSGGNGTLDLGSQGSYRVVLVATDNDGASTQKVWSFDWEPTDDGNGDGNGNNGGSIEHPTVDDMRLVDYGPKSYSTPVAGLDRTFTATVENTSGVGSNVGVVWRIDGIDVLSQSTYIVGGATITLEQTASSSYLSNFPHDGTLTAEIVQVR